MRFVGATLVALLLIPLAVCQDTSLVIKGETKVAPYRLVRLKAEGLRDKSNVKWKVVAVDPANQSRIDFSTANALKSKTPEFVAPPGEYRVTLRALFLDAQGVPDDEETETTVVIGIPTPVPPGPTPVPPGPDPPAPTPDGPAPIPAPGLRVLILEETSERNTLTRGQREVLFGEKVRTYLRTNCVTTPTNPDGAFRIWDKDVDMSTDTDGANWIAGKAYKKPTAYPWLVISNGRTGTAGHLIPTTTGDEFIKLLNTYKP